MVEVNRRTFLVAAGSAAGVAWAENEKILDGGMAEVSRPGVPERTRPIAPPGARSWKTYTRKCVACQLCVQQCPSHVLRPIAKGPNLLQPEMGFERGYCRPECTRCGEVCPAGAIRKISPDEKRHVHVGRAVWHKDRCLAASDGVPCDACVRHCPVGALTLIPLEEAHPEGPRVPVVDDRKCIGCGACEHLCPARPLAGLTVEGYERHREVKPMGEEDLLAEARRLLTSGQAAVVLAKDGVICATNNGRGLGPLLGLYDNQPDDLKGAWVIDKVIGKAAAAVCVAGGAARVHAELMGQAGVDYLKAHGIPCTATKIVPLILNRDQTGSCPLEATVKDLSDNAEMLKALRAKIAELRQAARSAAAK